MLNDQGQEIITNRVPAVKPTWKAKPICGMPNEDMLAKLMGKERAKRIAKEKRERSYDRRAAKVEKAPAISPSLRPKAIMDLMADGRERTSEDIANRIGGTACQVASTVHKLTKQGKLVGEHLTGGIMAWRIVE